MTKQIPQQLPQLGAALLSGLIFGFGLALSGMLNPARVRGFLDIFGHFDASLAFVLAGAVAVSTAGYALSRRLKAPLLDDAFHIPERAAIDRALVLGAALFGVGWGIGGFCPGPGVAALALGLPAAFVFTAAMAVGVLAHDYWRRDRGPAIERAALAVEQADA
jgi:uncharacterized membrane protein YedE/YeeE